MLKTEGKHLDEVLEGAEKINLKNYSKSEVLNFLTADNINKFYNSTDLNSISANSEIVDYQLSQMVSTLGKRNRQNYYRINPSIKDASPEMDDVRKENIEALIQAGLSYVDEHKELLHQLTQKLIKNKVSNQNSIATTFGTIAV